MTVAQQFFIFLCATTMTFNCNADYQLPEPTDVTYRWDDQFQVNVSWSWKKPDNHPKNCTVKYEVIRYGLPQSDENFLSLVNNFTVKYFTEDKHSDHWNISIQAVDPVCRKKSRPVNKTIKTSKRRTELVTDFRCSLESERTKCFWKPVNESVKLNISYRTSEEHDKIRACDGSTGHEKDVCYLNVNNLKVDIYVLVETETGRNTLKPKFVIPLPKMNIAEDKGNLYLTWEHRGPAVGKCGLNYSVCITECNNVRTLHTKGPSLEIPYNKNCQYKFQYSVQTDQYCIPLSSDLSEVITHGENRSPDEMLTVIAIVVPIILSVSVILSCYCFQRNREIFCPRIPDPSTIFKEMMMTGNRDSKPIPGNLYTPVPEPTEHIILVSENMIPEEAS
ncbi:interleukin-13 receptor subunit alpha-1-like isoform X2 [Neolamprologus brichardi]|uniref:interleukin-13 receptor subunit alpha-1-like isoform X2 n=1 Tax=Neolamprologus brichardi TaxID=32507 RepID=UPI001643F284|nr:interleukin-13 receptor subunit alpha-1-like isoform X2 [Neolamprologus brichardi]